MDDEMSENILASKWILSKKDQSTETKPRLRLLCFPQAGSGAWVYQEWQSQCPEDVQVSRNGKHNTVTHMKDPVRWFNVSLLAPPSSLFDLFTSPF